MSAKGLILVRGRVVGEVMPVKAIVQGKGSMMRLWRGGAMPALGYRCRVTAGDSQWQIWVKIPIIGSVAVLLSMREQRAVTVHLIVARKHIVCGLVLWLHVIGRHDSNDVPSAQGFVYTGSLVRVGTRSLPLRASD